MKKKRKIKEKKGKQLKKGQKGKTPTLSVQHYVKGGEEGERMNTEPDCHRDEAQPGISHPNHQGS